MDQLLTVTQVAAVMNVDGSTVREWIRSGDLEALPLTSRNKGYRITQDALDAFRQKKVSKISRTSAVRKQHDCDLYLDAYREFLNAHSEEIVAKIADRVADYIISRI